MVGTIWILASKKVNKHMKRARNIQRHPAQRLKMIVIMIALLFISFGILSWYRSQRLQNTQQNAVLGENDATWPKFGQYLNFRGKTRRPMLGPTQDIRLIQISSTCLPSSVDSTLPASVEMRLNQAFLISTIPDISSELFNGYLTYQKLDPGQYNNFLVLQGWARNVQFPDSKNRSYYYHSARYFRIKLSDRVYEAFPNGTQFGPPPLETRPFWTTFPVKSSDSTFTIEFCHKSKPELIQLDFSSSVVQKLRGNYSIDYGLFLDK